MGAPPTADDVAAFMVQEFEKHGYLDQRVAAGAIRDRFGETFLYTNKNGNPAISPEVLKRFGEITKGTAVWMRGSFGWRRRLEGDDPNRRTSY